MSQDNGHVVVYESEAQRLLDQWVWHGGGWAWILGLLVVLLLAGLVKAVIDDRRKNPRARGF